MRLRTPSPTAAANEAQEHQQDQCADGGVDNCRKKARAKMDAQAGKEPAPDECAEDSDDEIAYESKAGALDNFTGEPSGDESDYQYDNEAFIYHGTVSQFPLELRIV